ncbi:hypothetical protein CCP3SC15_1520001 [Gammaproteobacteria bacterium]
MIGISPSTLPSTPSVYIPSGISTARGTGQDTGETTQVGAQGGTQVADTWSHSDGCSCTSCSGKATTNSPTGQETKDPSSSPSSSGKTTDKRTGQDPNDDAVQKLKSRDREVRAHEAAHLAAAGGFALGGPHFTYQRGPDGQLYAIGGSVNIDVSPVSGDPKATENKARIIRSAALAPNEPSGQDQAVAAAATQMAQKAEKEISQQQNGTGTEGKGTNSDKTKVGKTGQNPSTNSTQKPTSAAVSSSTSSSPTNNNGTLPYGSNEIMTSTAGQRLQTALIATRNVSSAKALNVYA